MENKQQIGKILFSIGKALYDNGKYPEAFGYLELAANDGNADAMVLCGKIMYEGNEDGEVDYEKAKDFYKKAADLENIRGMFEYGQMLRYGIGCKIDKIKAYEFFKKAEEETNKNRKYLEEKNEEKITIPECNLPELFTDKKYDLPECNMILNPYDCDERIYDFAKNNMENLASTSSRDELICDFFNIFLEKCEIYDAYNIFLFACRNNKIDLIEKVFSFYIFPRGNNEDKYDEDKLLLDSGLEETYNKNYINSTKKIIQLKILKFFGKFLNKEDKEKLFKNILEIRDVSNIYTKTKEPILYKILASDFVKVSPIFVETIIKVGMNFGENGFNCNRNELSNINKTIQILSEKFGLNQENDLSKQITNISNKKGMFLFRNTITVSKEDLEKLNENLAEFSRMICMSIENGKKSKKSLTLKNFEDDFDKKGKVEKVEREFK